MFCQTAASISECCPVIPIETITNFNLFNYCSNSYTTAQNITFNENMKVEFYVS